MFYKNKTGTHQIKKQQCLTIMSGIEVGGAVKERVRTLFGEPNKNLMRFIRTQAFIKAKGLPGLITGFLKVLKLNNERYFTL